MAVLGDLIVDFAKGRVRTYNEHPQSTEIEIILLLG
jgi:hypothetical protein